MKKFLIMLLVLCLLAGNAWAVEIDGADVFALNEKTQADLDGDGAAETVILEMEGVPGEEYLALYLFGADGSFYTHEMYVMQLIEAFAADINGDGMKELFVVCDYYSDDYATFCFNYNEAGGMNVLTFADINRYAESAEFTGEGYGKVTAVNGNTITLTGSQDILGTWLASRDFALVNGGFELVDGLYSFETQESDWEDRPLITVDALDVTLADGSSATFPAGEEFLPTASDRQSMVQLVTRDGIECSIEISYNDETGWGWLIGGVPDEEIFEFIPYAD